MSEINGHSKKGLPKDWQIQKLGDLCIKITNGSSAKQYEEKIGLPISRIETIWNSTIDWDRVKYIKENEEGFIVKYALQNNDILFSHINSDNHIGKTAIFKSVNGKLIHGINLLLIRPDINKINADFFNYQLKYLKYRGAFSSVAQKAVNQSSINQAKLKQFDIVVPPINHQQQIVSIIEELFSELDKSIEQLKTAQQQLKVYRQSVLKWAFEGRFTNEWRDQQTSLISSEELLKKIKNDHEKHFQVANKKLKPVPPISNDEVENLNKLPKGWIWCRLGDVVWSVKDGPHYSPKYQEKGIPFISGGNVRPEGIDFSKAKYISRELHDELSLRCKPELNDVLYTKGGTTGIARVNTYSIEFNVWVHVAVLKPTKSILPFYLQYVLNSNHCYKQSQKYTHGVGNQDLGLTRMVLITVPICSFEEQQQVIQEIESRLSVADKLEETIANSLQQAEALRQSILKKAFEGELL